VLQGILVAALDCQLRLFNDSGLFETTPLAVPLAGMVFGHVWGGAYVLGKAAHLLHGILCREPTSL
jgi:hypothetical protein